MIKEIKNITVNLKREINRRYGFVDAYDYTLTIKNKDKEFIRAIRYFYPEKDVNKVLKDLLTTININK